MSSPPATTSKLEQFNALRRRLGPAGPIAVLATIAPPLGLLTLSTLAFSTSLPQWMRENPGEAIPLYVGVFWVAGIIALPTYAYSILGGYAFGFITGSIAAFVAYVGACTAAFAIGRYFARDRVLPLIAEHPKLLAVQHVIVSRSVVRTAFLICLIRLSPATPFAIANLTLGAGGLSWLPYLIGTFVGVLPRTAAVVWVASQMSDLNFNADGGVWLFVAGLVATFVAIAVIGWLVRRELDRQIAMPPQPPTVQ